MRSFVRITLMALCAGTGALAQSDDVAMSLEALDDFSRAQAQLSAAQNAPDRVAALTSAVQAYEEGLQAMRGGLRTLVQREALLEQRMSDQSEEVAALTGVLMSLKPNASPDALVHPNGALGQARAGMLLSTVTPALQQQSASLSNLLTQTKTVRAQRQKAVSGLEDGLAAVQEARRALSQAISERTDLPRRFASDPDLMAQMSDDAQSMEDFAAALAVVDAMNNVAPIATSSSVGRWPWPASGRVLRRFGDTDAAGVSRPGWLLATAPQALATAPRPATIRYLGPLLDYGNVIILEPENDVLIVLAGFKDVYGSVGQVINQGDPIGLMGGTAPTRDDFLQDFADGAGAALSETLYIEVRRSGRAEDPATWFED